MSDTLNIHVIDASRPASLRAGIKWEALDRDHIDELYDIGGFDVGKRRLKAIPQQLFVLRAALKICETLGVAKAVERIGSMVALKEKERVDLKAYVDTENIPSFDLDLCCFCYGADRKLAGFVTPSLTEMIIETVNYEPAFLHSGDDLTGVGDVFDEEMIINLHQIEPAIHEVYLLVVSFNYGFNEVGGGGWGLLDTKTEDLLMTLPLETESASRVHVMARLRRGDGKSWQVEQMGDYLEIEPDEKILLQKRIDAAIKKKYLGY